LNFIGEVVDNILFCTGYILGFVLLYKIIFVWGKEREYYWDWDDRDSDGHAKLKYKIKKDD